MREPPGQGGRQKSDAHEKHNFKFHYLHNFHKRFSNYEYFFKYKLILQKYRVSFLSPTNYLELTVYNVMNYL